MNYAYKIKVQYSVVIEFQKRGAVHYHVILYNLLEKLDLKELSKIWSNGFIKINVIDTVTNVGAYICKYMTKTDDIRLLGRKMYYSSRNLKKPVEIKEKSLINDDITTHLVNKTLTYENVFENEYNSISYKQYNTIIK